MEQRKNNLVLPKGIFILSLDFELAWGTRGKPELMPDYLRTRQTIDRLLSLLSKYGISATWATVGHLFLGRCSPVEGVKHPELVRSSLESVGRDWLDIDPCTDAERDPVWYGKDIVEKILACPVKQEIGCHTFSHLPVDDARHTRERFSSELTACKNAATSFGVRLKSFVYPKNHVDKIDVLVAHDFAVYRGRDKNWYAGFSPTVRRVCHVLDNYLRLPTRAVRPGFVNGIWEIPGSYFYPHAHGWAKRLPIGFRTHKALAGLNEAADKKLVYHLWLHPFNLSSDPDGLLAGLETVFKKVNELRDQGMIDCMSMGEAAENFDHLCR